VRLRVLLPLTYVVIGFFFLVLLGSSHQAWGPEPFYYATLPSVLLIQLTGVIPPNTTTAMLATVAAGVTQYALVGYGLDQWRGSRKKQLP
jgi:hypothetical protein